MQPTIGISGVATSGKDTFGNLLIEALHKRGYKAQRFALADELKKQVAPFILKEYGIDVFRCSQAEKTFVRPIMVAHGEIKRQTTDGTYWLNLLDKAIEEAEPGIVPVVTDVRYAYYPNDEFFWIKEKRHGLIVHLERYITHAVDESGVFHPFAFPVAVKPANETEEKHDGALKEKADYNVPWLSAPSKDPTEVENWCRPYVTKFLESEQMTAFLNRCLPPTAIFA